MITESTLEKVEMDLKHYSRRGRTFEVIYDRNAHGLLMQKTYLREEGQY